MLLTQHGVLLNIACHDLLYQSPLSTMADEMPKLVTMALPSISIAFSNTQVVSKYFSKYTLAMKQNVKNSLL
jgi:hypothetical protein